MIFTSEDDNLQLDKYDAARNFSQGNQSENSDLRSEGIVKCDLLKESYPVKQHTTDERAKLLEIRN